MLTTVVGGVLKLGKIQGSDFKIKSYSDGSKTELLLYIASRRQRGGKVLPALEAGKLVVWTASSIVPLLIKDLVISLDIDASD